MMVSTLDSAPVINKMLMLLVTYCNSSGTKTARFAIMLKWLEVKKKSHIFS